MKNKKVVLYSFLALIFLVLTYLIDWIFILGAVAIIYLNQKELFKKNK